MKKRKKKDPAPKPKRASLPKGLDPKIADAVTANAATVHATAFPQADVIARLGFAKIQAGEIVTPEALDATYIRRTDAELKLSTML